MKYRKTLNPHGVHTQVQPEIKTQDKTEKNEDRGNENPKKKKGSGQRLIEGGRESDRKMTRE